MKRCGICLLITICLFALLAPLISPYDPNHIELTVANKAPSATHWFGTDDLGRDVFTRVWIGARISLLIGTAAALIDLCIGVLWGGVAAALGGWADEILMRTADIVYALPYLLIVICLLTIIGQGLFTMILAMGIIGWIPMARIVRGEVLRLKEAEFVLASRVMGGTTPYILRKHLLPNTYPAVMATLAMTIPTAIFTEAFLSFVGLGVPPPLASWGTMTNQGLPALYYYPWRLLFPALMITLTILSFNLITAGDEDGCA